ncbi:MAG: nitrilase-related carbon-nitrogen hydrolase [Thermotogota bacterium]|nr:nitrilase-related carbon-nitrogen hydrolase [Thermotogota bacterium]
MNGLISFLFGGKNLLKISLLTQNIFQDLENKNTEAIITCAMIAAKEKDSTILFTPELSLQGFPNELEKPVSPIEPERINEIKKAAHQYEISIGFGYFEHQSGNIYNSYSIINPKGNTIGFQRKRKTFKYAKEDLYIKAATETKDFILEGMKTRIVICFGLRFPSLFQSESECPQLYIVPANWPKTRIHHWEALLIARAIETQAWIIGINRTKGIYNGHSLVINPNGEVVEKNNEGLLSFKIDAQMVSTLRKKFPIK